MSEDVHKAEKQRGSAEAGLVYFCSVLTGIAGLIGAVVAIGANQFIGGGIFLVASALMFGLLANAFYRQ